ncbi:MAG: hypothetical protein Q8K32_32660 [Archangium sp.]|nr:hypothetical protein [Archangium sp.]
MVRAAMNLEGAWHVVASNFPMWMKGDRTRPRFIYSNPRVVEGRQQFDDTVEYVQGGRTKTIVGVDTQESAGSPKYVWRGTGWLRFMTSRWEVIHVAADERCLALSFSKTWATPAGIDIIARSPAVDFSAVRAAIGSPSLMQVAW